MLGFDVARTWSRTAERNQYRNCSVYMANGNNTFICRIRTWLLGTEWQTRTQPYMQTCRRLALRRSMLLARRKSPKRFSYFMRDLQYHRIQWLCYNRISAYDSLCFMRVRLCACILYFGERQRTKESKTCPQSERLKDVVVFVYFLLDTILRLFSIKFVD